MSALDEVKLTALREIRRNLRSAKGLSMVILFLIGGVVPNLLLLAVRLYARNKGIPEPTEEQVQQGFKILLEQPWPFGFAGEDLDYLSKCPPLVFFTFYFSTYFLPWFSLMLGFDQVAGDVQHRTFRFMTVRARRGALVAGKALGVWALVAMMVLLMHSTVWMIAIARGDGSAGAIFVWGLKGWFFCTVYSAAFIGLATMISALVRTPALALFIGVGSLLGLWFIKFVSWLMGMSEKMKFMQHAKWAFPANYFELMLSHDLIY